MRDDAAFSRVCVSTPAHAQNSWGGVSTPTTPWILCWYVIEGAASQGGRGQSIWDVFCHNHPDAIVNGDNGDNGTEAYYKYKEDVQLMKKMGLIAYRFSISWTKILPDGRLSSGINKEGVDYYNNLINELILNGITPYATVFHWDTPESLEIEYRGFLSEKIIYDFTAYARVCFSEFGDRVKNWITINEPHSYSSDGYATGKYAPGRGKNGVGDPGTEPYIVGHNLLLCHASAVQLYRQSFQGYDWDYTELNIFGATRSSEKGRHGCSPQTPGLHTRNFHFRFMEPLFRGKYPDIMIRLVTGGRLPKFTEDQARLLKGSYDFIGFNYYNSEYATTAEPSVPPSYLTDSLVHTQTEDLNGKPIGPKGGTDWLYSYPPGFYKILMHIKHNYGNPLILITENGWADENNNDNDIKAACADNERIVYHQKHLQSLRDAIRDGVRAVGYFAWALMDNFEWNSGYSVRFDYNDEKYTRYAKNSAIWYRNFIKNRDKVFEQKKLPEVDTKKPIVVVAFWALLSVFVIFFTLLILNVLFG
ncbi:hypothetical protein LXL04_015544 [Taraxacum kok-saghyz]